jgi:alpha-ketoglutarate-dependent taurine dioxygenase
LFAFGTALPRVGGSLPLPTRRAVDWDNRATLHARNAFDDGERRVLKRVRLACSGPF